MAAILPAVSLWAWDRVPRLRHLRNFEASTRLTCLPPTPAPTSLAEHVYCQLGGRILGTDPASHIYRSLTCGHDVQEVLIYVIAAASTMLGTLG